MQKGKLEPANMIFFPLNCPILDGKFCMRGRNVRFMSCFFWRKQYKSKVEAPLMMQMMMVETDTLSAAFTARLRGARG